VISLLHSSAAASHSLPLTFSPTFIQKHRPMTHDPWSIFNKSSIVLSSTPCSWSSRGCQTAHKCYWYCRDPSLTKLSVIVLVQQVGTLRPVSMIPMVSRFLSRFQYNKHIRVQCCWADDFRFGRSHSTPISESISRRPIALDVEARLPQCRLQVKYTRFAESKVVWQWWLIRACRMQQEEDWQKGGKW